MLSIFKIRFCNLSIEHPPVGLKDWSMPITKNLFSINAYEDVRVFPWWDQSFKKFSKISFSGLYDLKKEINKEYAIGYTYFDECFGINIDFSRKSYEEDSLKPQDILTLMFSFKNVGSYKSTNLAVSENDKQDIEWLNYDLDNEQFNKN